MAKLRFAAVMLLLISLTFLTLSNTASATSDEVKWCRVNIPAEGEAGNRVLADGSDIQHLTMAVDGTLYVYGKGLTYTLYKSTDGGYSWSDIGDVQDEIVDIATAPDDASTIYYATTADVYKSTDGGRKFARLPPNPGGAGSNNIEITSLDVIHLYSNIIAVGTRDADNAQFGGVYTLDEEHLIPGWVDSNIGNYDVYAVAFSPGYTTDRQLVAVVTDETDTLVTSKVGEAGWGTTTSSAKLDKDNSGTATPVAVANSATIAFPDDYDATSAECVQFVAIDTGSDDGDVYKIDTAAAPGNSVATDLNIGAGYGLSNVDVTGLAVTGTGNNASLLAGAADSAQTYFSADGGNDWTRSRKEPTGGSETCVIMAPDFSSSGRAYAATSGNESAFSVSQGDGARWNQISLIDTTISDIVDVAPSPDYSQDTALFMLTFGSGHSLWQSLDAGTTWERIFASCLTQVNSIDMVELSPQYGNDSEVVFIAGNSNGSPAIWKSTDNGQKFRCRGTYDPDSGDAFPIYAWAVVNDTTVFIGSYDGSDGLVYQTNDSGFSYSSGAKAGSQAPTSLVLSPNYEQDGTLLISNSDSWVYWSSDNGSSFEPLPPDATSAPLTGAITVAFDPDFGSNKTVYAVSDSADEGVYRFTIGTDTEWESIDSNLPGGSTLNQVIVSAGGTLYAANSQTDSGIERCLNPTYSLGPTFETVTRGLSDNATLSGLWQDDDRLWSTDTNHAKLMTFLDNLTSPVALTSPPDAAAGIGTIINYAISHVSLDWEATESATSYQWQLDYDTDFSSVPSEFEDNTKASSVHLPTLEPAATYYWRVRVSEPVLSPWSAKWSFTTILDTETAVLKLESPKAGAIGMPVRPLFQWSAVPGADVYELLVSTDVQFANPSIVKAGAYALPATAWQGDISLGYDATYYWKVRAVSTNTYSAWSAAGTFTTEAMPISPAPTPASSPTLILPVPAPQTLTPSVSPTAPPTLPPVPPTPTQIPTTPDWVIYLVGALLLTIILLVITLFVLVIGVRRA